MGTTPILPLSIKWTTQWPLPPRIQILLLHLRNSSLVATVPTVTSNPWKGASSEHFQGAKPPLTNLFLTVVIKCVFSAPSQSRWAVLHDKSTSVHSPEAYGPFTLRYTKAGLAFQLHLARSPFGPCFSQTTKLLELFLTPQAITVNPESLLSGPLSINLTWSTSCSLSHYPTPSPPISAYVYVSQIYVCIN